MTAAAAPSCGQKRHIRWPATNASACNELLARNEFQVLMCHHAVRKDTHAGLQRMLWHAMNYGCGTQPVLTREFCQIKNASACELAPAWTSKQQSDLINYRSICLSIDLSISLCIYLSLHVSIYASIDVSIYLSISLSIYQCNVAWGSVI